MARFERMNEQTEEISRFRTLFLIYLVWGQFNLSLYILSHGRLIHIIYAMSNHLISWNHVSCQVKFLLSILALSEYGIISHDIVSHDIMSHDIVSLAMPYHSILSHGILSDVMPYHIASCHPFWWYAYSLSTLSHTTLSHISCHPLSCHVKSPYLMPSYL